MDCRKTVLDMVWPLFFLSPDRNRSMARLGWMLFLGGVLGVVLPALRPGMSPLRYWFGAHSLLVSISLLILGIVFVVAPRDK